ncbi:MAG: efflux RND transporter periplasmic adaptor subunit [Desulfovibrionaceae bacterium]
MLSRAALRPCFRNLYRPVLAALLAAMLAAVAGCSGEADGANQAPPPPPVKIGTVHRADVPLTFSYTGSTQGVREINVRARTGGILLERRYMEGAFVEQGDLLFTIDPEKNDANLSQMLGELARNRATMENARRERDRLVKLFGGGAVSASERDDAVTAYESAAASVQESSAKVNDARISRNYNEVRAPISGVTSKESLSEGSLISESGENSILTTITQLDPFYVTFAVPGSEDLRNRRWQAEGKLVVPEEGYTLRLTLVDGSCYPHHGFINFRDKRVDPDTGSILMRGEFTNPDLLVLPGQYAHIFLEGAKLKDAITMPQRGVLFTQQGPFVYVLDENNVASLRPVKLGLALEKDFVVEEGLEDGERVVTEGIIMVRPGAPVTPTNGEEPASTAAEGGSPCDKAAE